MIKLTLSDDGFYSEQTRLISLAKVATLVREGKSVLVVDRQGYDITKETLVEFALGRACQSHDADKKKLLIELLTNIIDEDTLDNAVCCGGFQELSIRRLKMLA